MNPISLTILTPDKEPVSCSLHKGDYLVGRGADAHIRLRDKAVSERHAVLRITDDGVFVEDLGSSNGTLVNGVDIAPDTIIPLSSGDKVAFGSYLIRFEWDDVKSQSEADSSFSGFSDYGQKDKSSFSLSGASSLSAGAQGADADSSSKRFFSDSQKEDQKTDETQRNVRRDIKNQIHRELVNRLDLKQMSVSRTSSEELGRRAKEILGNIVSEIRSKLPPGIDPDRLSTEIFNEALRLGPLEDFLADDSISEIMINGPGKVFVERNGRLELTDQTFMDDASVQAVIERIVSPIGRRIDESQPYVDARLADGSRVNAIIPPLSLVGPCITIRKFSKVPLTVEDFVRFGTWTYEMAHFLDVCVKMRKNIIVAGGTGSGKTTLLNLLSSFIPRRERIVTIEDAAELRLEQPHLVRLESRPPNIEGKGAITIRDLVRNALRMRPDRIIVGECRGGEALDMLQAMNTGHDGSLTTVHANTPRDVISRLETMVLMSGMELPSRAIREQISSAVDLIVQESRFSDGSRKITHVSEVMGLEGTQTVMQDIFVFKQTGVSEDGRIQGYLAPTGSVPSFFEQIRLRGLELDPTMFQPKI